MRVFVMLLRMLVYLLLAAVGLCAVMMLLRLLTDLPEQEYYSLSYVRTLSEEFARNNHRGTTRYKQIQTPSSRSTYPP
jgi:hypothetical protein